jgi:hypothetical protein
VIGITIACDVTAADLLSATNSMMHKKECVIRMAEVYMRQFGWSVGHPTYMESSCERLISGASFEVSGIALSRLLLYPPSPLHQRNVDLWSTNIGKILAQFGRASV